MKSKLLFPNSVSSDYETADEEWLCPILGRDAEAMEKMLKVASSNKKNSLLNGRFVYKDKHLSKHIKGDCFRLELPLALAIAVGGNQITRLLYECGVNVHLRDHYGNNVIHSIIACVSYHPKLERTVVDNFTYLISLLSLQDIKNLLHAENQYGMRPLEFAAQHGTCLIMTALFEIPGVYLTREERYGMTRYRWYDVTDYEGNGPRIYKSPLLLMTFIDKSIGNNQWYKALHEKSYIKKWSDIKFRSSYALIALLFLVRILYVTTYIIVDMDTSSLAKSLNATKREFCRPNFAISLSDNMNYILNVYLLCHSVCVIILDIIETTRMYFKSSWAVVNTIHGRKRYLVQTLFYRYSNLLFSVFAFIYSLLFFLPGVDQKTAGSFFDITRVLCPILAVWHFLFFVQLLPIIGNFVITIQRLLVDLFSFIIIYFILVIPFMHSFQTIINSNTNQGCIDRFTSIPSLFYSLFSIMLNLIDLTKYNIRNIVVLEVAHIAFTFIISVMLINFFIALLSNSAGESSANKTICLRLQRLSVAYLLLWRCVWYVKTVMRKINRKHFVVENDKIYLVDVEHVFE